MPAVAVWLLAAAMTLLPLPALGGDTGPATADPADLPQVDMSFLPEPMRTQALGAQQRAKTSPQDPNAAGELGMRYLAHDFPQAAAVCLRRAALLEPTAMRWRYYLGLALAAAGDTAGAAEALAAAARLDETYAPTLVELAGLLREQDPSRAEELYRRAAAMDPNDARARLGLGLCARDAGRREEATRQLGEAVRIVPDYADAHYALAMVLSASGRSQEAQMHLHRHAAGGEPPRDSDPLRQELIRLGQTAASMRRDAERLARSGRLQEAAALLEQAIAIDRSGATTRVHLGLVLARQGKFVEAERQFRLALEVDPGDVEARSSLGLALVEQRRFEEAERSLQEVLNRHPDHAPSLVYRGQLLARQGRVPEALESMRRGVRAQPANGLFQLALGDMLTRAGHEGGGAEAVAHLRKAAQLMPWHAGAHNALGARLAAAGDMQGARQEWEEAIAIAPGMADAHAGLAEVALSERDPAAAVAHAERACALGGYANAGHLKTLGRAYEAAGRGSDAARVRALAERAP